MNKKYERILVAAAALIFTALAAQAAPYVVLKSGKKVEGQRIRAKSNGTIELTTAQGTVTYPKGSYRRAYADRPAEMNQAKQALKAGKADEAVKLLNTLARSYKGLGWDIEASKLLPQAYMMAGDFDKAVKGLEKFMRSEPSVKGDPGFQMVYAEALMKAGEFSKLERILDQSIKSGTREAAAKAQNLRGDMLMEQGQTEAAFLDYMRTITFFKKQADSAAEAAYKAGVCLETMRDKRAADMYRTVIQNFPRSKYAAAAQKKLK